MSGDVGILDYTLWLPNATVIEGATGFSYTHDVTNVIQGFRDGVHRMLLGEQRLIVIPSDQAYGRNPPSGIPTNAILVFRVELQSIG